MWRWPPPWLLVCDSKDIKHTEVQKCMQKQDPCPGRSPPFYEVWDLASLTALTLSIRKKKREIQNQSQHCQQRPITWQSCFSLLQWPAGTELRQTISSCQRTSAGIQKWTWIASSFTININKPSRNKLSQLCFKDSATYWISTEMQMSSASLEQAIFEILVWFCYWLKWQKNGTLQCGQLPCMNARCDSGISQP